MIDKKKVDELLPDAYTALEESGIAVAGKIDKAFRGQIASFGASIINSTVRSAIVFFSRSKEEGSRDKAGRSKLIEAIAFVLKKEGKITEDSKNAVYQYAGSNEKEAEQTIMEIATALKLAMNLFELVDSPKDTGGGADE
ncbi:hypothetical protein [Lactovum odontotermitis]